MNTQSQTKFKEAWNSEIDTLSGLWHTIDNKADMDRVRAIQAELKEIVERAAQTLPQF